MVALAAVRSANPMFHLLPREEASGCEKSPTFQVRCGCCGVRAALLFHLEFTAKARASCKGTGIELLLWTKFLLGFKSPVSTIDQREMLQQGETYWLSARTG